MCTNSSIATAQRQQMYCSRRESGVSGQCTQMGSIAMRVHHNAVEGSGIWATDANSKWKNASACGQSQSSRKQTQKRKTTEATKNSGSSTHERPGFSDERWYWCEFRVYNVLCGISVPMGTCASRFSSFHGGQNHLDEVTRCRDLGLVRMRPT